MEQKVVREILREHAGSYWHLYRLRHTLIEQGRLPEARSVLKRLILLVPPHDREVISSLWSMLAEIDFRLELVDEAQRALDSAFTLDGKNNQAWEIRAQSLWKSGELLDACGAMECALSHALNADEERRAHLLRSCAKLQQELGHPHLAESNLKKAASLCPAALSAP